MENLNLKKMSFLVAFLVFLPLFAIGLDEMKYSARKRKDFEAMFENRSILAFGDSLTYGMNVLETGLAPAHPYSIELERLINKINIRVHNFGISGERTSEMIVRLPAVLKRFEMKSIKLAVLLGGTNDLAHEDTDMILNNLINMHQAVHNVGTPYNPVFSIAIAIPDLKWDVDQNKRHIINKGLFKYAQQCSHLVHYRDFEHLFDQSKPENHKYWSTDMVHFSALGYDEIGKHLYSDILSIAHKATVNSNITEMC